jgi:addiction module HigA family antidote
MNAPGYGFHALTGNMRGRYAVSVSCNWRITFAWSGTDAIDIDLEDIMASRITRHPSIAPAHPGEQLEEIVIPATGRSKSEIARLLGISRQTLYEIINGARPITPSIAARLGKLFGDGPGIWLRMQAAHDAWVAEREIDVSDIPTLHANRS